MFIYYVKARICSGLWCINRYASVSGVSIIVFYSFYFEKIYILLLHLEFNRCLIIFVALISFVCQ